MQKTCRARRRPRPGSNTFEGKTIGLWNNAKLNAALLLEMIREELEKDYSFEVLHGVYDPGNLMPADGWGEIDRCDAVIMANGDCGACSTSGIVNAIELEKRGIPGDAGNDAAVPRRGQDQGLAARHAGNRLGGDRPPGREASWRTNCANARSSPRGQAPGILLGA